MKVTFVANVKLYPPGRFPATIFGPVDIHMY